VLFTVYGAFGNVIPTVIVFNVILSVRAIFLFQSIGLI